MGHRTVSRYSGKFEPISLFSLGIIFLSLDCFSLCLIFVCFIIFVCLIVFPCLNHSSMFGPFSMSNYSSVFCIIPLCFRSLSPKFRIKTLCIFLHVAWIHILGLLDPLNILLFLMKKHVISGFRKKECKILFTGFFIAPRSAASPWIVRSRHVYSASETTP
ncbi:hypothetical protein METBIDRAFT_179506 [Metschnikowia bicuspidata var. bicuspidata NRRL YB-4993]|uniref:Uncharacterized protein n=1 Tax=Metschnikowia bicuspidata var. bicuspidata NRRL YB-4993 TaxID=869754 RepID=A0A1A0HAY7_9ASCO|nr:hypothetical protein METBIDRAFT_179506 [Metschnikowia bicuspidata var. bicuspidata NRRL YB-4993]OBA21289.1 hypothetical protein METBIDRAFT_179506 [Metschnikowia bicuspidata var. bicuspidata NRRL YB-4993]